MDSLIDIDEPETTDKIIKTLHYYLDNNDSMKTKINGSINTFINFYSNIKIDKEKLKKCIYNYTEKYYIETLKYKYSLIKSQFGNDISRCNFELKRRYTDILYDINKYPNNDDNKDYNYMNEIFCQNFSFYRINFNTDQIYYYFLFNELNDSINNNYDTLNDKINKHIINNNYETINDNIKSIKDNYKNFNGKMININDTLNKHIIDINDTIKNNFDILNGKIIETNHIIKNNYDILNEKISDTNSITNMNLININNIDNKTKILIDNYHILEKSIMDINSNINSNINANLNVKLKKFDDNYRLMIKINVILFITVIYNLVFK